MTKLHLMFPQSSTASAQPGAVTDLLPDDSTLNLWEWDIQRDLVDSTDYQNNLFANDKGQFFGPSQSFIERIHPQDRAYFQQQLDLARDGSQPPSWTFRLNANNRLIPLQLQTELAFDNDGLPIRLAGILCATNDEQTPVNAFAQLDECLQRWSHDPVLNTGNWSEGIKRICSTVASVSQAHCVSVWWFDKSYQTLNCIERFNCTLGTYSTDTDRKMPVLTQKDAKEYFQQLLSHQKLSCNDINNRISLESLRQQYLDPNQIGAKLDVLISYKGHGAGVLSLEHTSPRNWQVFDTALANCAANALTQLRLLSEQHNTQQQLTYQRQQFQTFVNKSEEGICKIRFEPAIKTNVSNEEQLQRLITNAVFDDINPAGAHLLKLSHEHLVKNPLSILSSPQGITAALNEWIHLGYQQSGLELHNAKTNGDARWLSATLTGFVEDNRLYQLWISLKDISEEKRHLETISYQAEHDSLTHLPNRFWLVDELRQQIALKEQLGGTLAVLLIDLNNFKEINNSLGHTTGDLLLRQVHPRLTRFLGEEKGTLVRLGGDEFAVFFSDISPVYANKLAAKCLQLLQRPFLLPGIKLEINASVGVALYPEHANDEESLLRCAEVAMYQAKREHQGSAVYEIDLDDHCPKRLALLSELSQGIDEDQLLLHYQPQIDLKNKHIIGFEALVRWNHPAQGLIPPNQFIHLAEMGDLSHPLTLWVIEKALKQWSLWRKQGHEFQIAINLSTRSLLDSSSPDAIVSLLNKHQVPAHFLDLEITENSLINNPTSVKKCLLRLHQAGIKLTLDDFGTEYSSLNYLKDLPIDNLKIDHSFVQPMSERNGESKIIKAIISLAHSLEVNVIAEGVESRRILNLLEELQCDVAQGFYLCEPKAVELLPLDYQLTNVAEDDLKERSGLLQ